MGNDGVTTPCEVQVNLLQLPALHSLNIISKPVAFDHLKASSELGASVPFTER